MHASLLILLLSTASIAFIHSLAPDHWMPFAALAKSLKWSKLKLALLTFVSGIGHVGISVIFSIIGILLGFSLTKLKNAEGRRAEIALWLLIGFGIAYMLWGIKKARGHKHKAFDQKALKSKTLALWMIFIIVVLGPCEPLVPLVFLGYNYGYMGVISVSIVFSITTIAMMVAQSLLAFKGIQLIKNDFIEKYSHAFAGLIIVLTGIFVMVAGI
jgi:nickel/cobalt transporter (NicO) family protein